MILNRLLLFGCGCGSSIRGSQLIYRNLLTSRINNLQFARSKSSRFRLLSLKNGDKDTKSFGFSQLWRLFSLAKPVRKRLAVGICLLFVSSGVTISVPYFIGRMVDSMMGNTLSQLNKVGKEEELTEEEKEKQKEQATKIMEKMRDFVLPLAALFCVGALANFGRYYCMQTASQRITARLRTKVFRSILSQEMAFFDQSKTGELINRLANDATRVSYSISMNVSDGLRSAVAFSGGMAMMIYTSPQMSIFSLALLLIICYAVVYGRIQRVLAKKMNDALANATQLAEERISNMLTVRAFVGEDKEVSAYGRKIDKVLAIARQEALVSGIFFGLNSLSGNLFIFGMLYAGGYFVLDGAVTIGQLASFLFYQVYAVSSLGGLGSVYSELMRGLGSSGRLFELMDRKALIPLQGGVIPPSVTGDVKFENVQFAFAGRHDFPVLTDINLHIKAGTVTALVGPSGSGKTTVAALLLRLYDPDSGRISVDGVDVRQYDPSWYKRQTGTVTQDPILFSSSIHDNIAYGAEDSESVTEDQVEEAAIKANALEFIQNFPEKFDTLVGERGALLSGGQRQRIAIARALLTNPSLLILDEATSALDAESEYLVRKALENLLKEHKRTVLIIAHRLSTVKNADQIAVLSGGSIAELGTYSQLMAIENGIFKQLVEKQTVSHSLNDF